MFCEHYDVKQYTSNVSSCGSDLCEQDILANGGPDERELISLHAKMNEQTRRLNEYHRSLGESKERFLAAGPLQQASEHAVATALHRGFMETQREQGDLMMQFKAKLHQINMTAHAQRSHKRITFPKDESGVAFSRSLAPVPETSPQYPAQALAVPSLYAPSTQASLYQHSPTAYRNTITGSALSGSVVPRDNTIFQSKQTATRPSSKHLDILRTKDMPFQGSMKDNLTFPETTTAAKQYGGGGAKRGRKPKIVSTAKPEPTSVRRSGRLSSKGKKNYAESSEEEVDEEEEPSPSRKSHFPGHESDPDLMTKAVRNKRKTVNYNEEEDDDDDEEYDIEQDPEEDEDYMTAAATSTDTTPTRKRKRAQIHAPSSGTKRQLTSFAMTGAALRQASKKHAVLPDNPNIPNKFDDLNRHQSLNQARNFGAESEFNRPHNASSLGFPYPNMGQQAGLAPPLMTRPVPGYIVQPTPLQTYTAAPRAPMWSGQSQQVSDSYRQQWSSGSPAVMSQYASGGPVGSSPSMAVTDPGLRIAGAWRAPPALAGAVEGSLGGAVEGDMGAAYQALENLDFDMFDMSVEGGM